MVLREHLCLCMSGYVTQCRIDFAMMCFISMSNRSAAVEVVRYGGSADTGVILLTRLVLRHVLLAHHALLSIRIKMDGLSAQR